VVKEPDPVRLLTGSQQDRIPGAEILFCDKHLIAANKFPGTLCIPGRNCGGIPSLKEKLDAAGQKIFIIELIRIPVGWYFSPEMR
jgi:hypothetical protein